MKRLISFLAFILPLVFLYQFVFGAISDKTESKPEIMLAMDIKIGGHWRHFSSGHYVSPGTYIVLEGTINKLLLEDSTNLVTE